MNERGSPSTDSAEKHVPVEFTEMYIQCLQCQVNTSMGESIKELMKLNKQLRGSLNATLIARSKADNEIRKLKIELRRLRQLTEEVK